VTLFVGQAFAEAVNSVDPSTLGGANGLFGLNNFQVGNAMIGSHDRLLLVRGDRAARADGAAAPARHLAHRPRLARGARRPTGSRGDDDPGQPRQGDGVHLRRDAVAALAGTVFAAQQSSVFPTNFSANT
jgi:hypothetical protein